MNKEKPKKYKIVPRSKQVVVRPDEYKSKISEGGIIIPTTVEQEQKATGTVLAVGDGIKDVKVGDKVIYGAYVGERLKMQEDNKEVDYILLFDEDVLAFLK